MVPSHGGGYSGHYKLYCLASGLFFLREELDILLRFNQHVINDFASLEIFLLINFGVIRSHAIAKTEMWG
jgi:hypothetical protein